MTSQGLVPYPDAVAEMERRVDRIADGCAEEAVWLLEHPPLYTVGRRAEAAEICPDPPFATFPTGRGGQVTYHGPGQRVVYVMIDLKKRSLGVHQFVRMLERWIILALEDIGVCSFSRQGRTGVWVFLDSQSGRQEKKIAAIGIRLRRWVSFHGVSINVSPDLDHYSAIVPCGITEYGVTSIAELAIPAEMHDLDRALKSGFKTVFSI